MAMRALNPIRLDSACGVIALLLCSTSIALLNGCDESGEPGRDQSNRKDNPAQDGNDESVTSRRGGGKAGPPPKPKREGPGDVGRYHFFYDLNTGKLFVADALEIAPIEAPSGKPFALPDGTEIPAGVRAFVYACGECDPKTRKIGYLEMYTQEAKNLLLKARKQEEAVARGEKTAIDLGMDFEEAFTRGRLIAERPEEGKPVRFFPTDGEGAEKSVKIMAALVGGCPKGKSTRLRPCYPTSDERPRR